MGLVGSVIQQTAPCLEERRLGHRLQEWLLEKGYLIGEYIHVYEDRFPLYLQAPYLDIFEKRGSYRERVWLFFIKYRRRHIGRLTFGKDREDAGPYATSTSWVLTCNGTEEQMREAMTLAERLANDFGIQITLRRTSDQPSYEHVDYLLGDGYE